MQFPVVFGVDVSKSSSTVCILINRKVNTQFKIVNDLIGFNQLLEKLQYFARPLIIFEATGVYSLPLQAFLDQKNYDYVRMNPLKAKKLMDNSLRHNKTDKADAQRLAMLQYAHPQKITPKQAHVYREMRNASRYYEELTKDIVKDKNRLHRALQSTFPQIEQLTTNHGQIYWQVIDLYPHAQLVLNKSSKQIYTQLRQIRGIGKRTANNYARKLKGLAKLTCYYDSPDSIVIDLIHRCTSQLREIEQKRQSLIAYINRLNPIKQDYQIYCSIPGIADKTATRLIAELGDLRRFDSANQIDAFIGIDPGRYQSGQQDNPLAISKHGNSIARKILYRTIVQMETVKKKRPCHITDYYDNKKRASHKKKGFKKFAIAAMHKLIHTIYALITNNQLYNYKIALRNLNK